MSLNKKQIKKTIKEKIKDQVIEKRKSNMYSWTQQENQFQWTDGSSWGYSDWMPGHPQKHKLSCLEMFRFGKN